MSATHQRWQNDYWRALGEFVESFSDTEVALFHLLATMTHVDIRVARVLFGTDKADLLVDRIRKLAELLPLPSQMWQPLAAALDQFKHIAATRNILIHQPSQEQIDGTRRSSDAVRSHSPDTPTNRERTVTPETVRQMTEDLLRIRHAIGWATFPHVTQYAEQVARDSGQAWRYKPGADLPAPQPKKPRRDRRRDTPR